MGKSNALLINAHCSISLSSDGLVIKDFDAGQGILVEVNSIENEFMLMEIFEELFDYFNGDSTAADADKYVDVYVEVGYFSSNNP